MSTVGRTTTLDGSMVHLAELARRWTQIVLNTSQCSTAIAAPSVTGRLRRIAEAGPPMDGGPRASAARREAFRTKQPRSVEHEDSRTSFVPLDLEDGASVAVLEVEVPRSRSVDDAQLGFMTDVLGVAVAAEHRRREADASLDMGLALTAHEIRSPLAGVRAVMDRVLDGRGGTEELRSAGAELDRVVGSVGTLLDQCVRGIAAVSEPVDLVSVVREIKESRPDESRRIRLSGHCTAVVSGDHIQLYSALDNLVRNALNYAPEGDAVRIAIKRSGQHVSVTVVDRGPGIDRTRASTIFEPLVRTPRHDNGHEGHGLGLFLVKRVVQAHGGEIDVTSRPGKTAFRVRLPLAGSTPA